MSQLSHSNVYLSRCFVKKRQNEEHRPRRSNKCFDMPMRYGVVAALSYKDDWWNKIFLCSSTSEISPSQVGAAVCEPEDGVLDPVFEDWGCTDDFTDGMNCEVVVAERLQEEEYGTSPKQPYIEGNARIEYIYTAAGRESVDHWDEFRLFSQTCNSKMPVGQFKGRLYGDIAENCVDYCHTLVSAKRSQNYHISRFVQYLKHIRGYQAVPEGLRGVELAKWLKEAKKRRTEYHRFHVGRQEARAKWVQHTEDQLNLLKQKKRAHQDISGHSGSLDFTTMVVSPEKKIRSLSPLKQKNHPCAQMGNKSDSDDECVLVGVKHDHFDVRFAAALNRSPNREKIMGAPNPPLILALQGGFDGPVFITTEKEMRLVTQSNHDRAMHGLNLIQVKMGPVIADEEYCEVVQSAKPKMTAAAAVPPAMNGLEDVHEKGGTTNVAVSGKSLDSLFSEVSKRLVTEDVNGFGKLRASMRLFHEIFQNGNYSANNPDLFACAQTIREDCQKCNIVNPDDATVVTAGVRRSWEQMLYACGNGDKVSFRLHLHELMFLMSWSWQVSQKISV